ncbi:aspartate racemase [Orbus hercynius]|uniref:Aspartate racemase n=1 Tax=Orbus hercynius TaxID=593135 RepID=A0A495RJR1_9GAMM|nr:aspartate/glutamate racemase family protein [Orbus hercynius]RKS87757.1 aspartate racemase [Orbus hercynius]
MKTIGLIGGMSWESTVTYYQVINRVIQAELGGLHSAKCIIYSVDFQEIEQCQVNGNWDKSGKILAQAAASLQQSGADFIIVCTNTMHKVFADIQMAITIPILHIAETTALSLKTQHIKKVALLGTQYTMEQNFYKQVIMNHGIEVIIPAPEDRAIINNIIYQELCLGLIKAESKRAFLTIMHKLANDGAQGIILGCTEIGLLIKQTDTAIALFDTCFIHAQYAALEAVGRHK